MDHLFLTCPVSVCIRANASLRNVKWRCFKFDRLAISQVSNVGRTLAAGFTLGTSFSFRSFLIFGMFVTNWFLKELFVIYQHP